jgi:hypothetical protein
MDSAPKIFDRSDWFRVQKIMDPTGSNCDSHIVVILHLQTFILISWERAQNFASFD